MVELGSGTGLFTRLLLSRPGAAKLATLTAVDPSAGMRAAFGTSITSLAAAVGPEISCLDGRFDQIPVPDATADLVVAAQVSPPPAVLRRKLSNQKGFSLDRRRPGRCRSRHAGSGKST